MSQVRLTKNELRRQQVKLTQLNRYLPTLQLKKALLQTEVNLALQEIEFLTIAYKEKKQQVYEFAKLLTSMSLDEFFENLHIKEVKCSYENIAGVETPIFEEVLFIDTGYSLYSSQEWWDSAISQLRELIIAKEKINVMEQKKAVLQKELRDVSIRVNLFEKILIPRTEANIKKIKVFLGDQQLSAVAQAKVAKEKITRKKFEKEEAI